MIKIIVFAFIAALVGCKSHTIRIKGGRFVTPVSAKEQWGGFAAVSAGADTRVTITDNTDGNPPTRDYVRINEDADVSDLFAFHMLGLEAGISPYKSLEVYLDNALIGLKWQFLNHDTGENKWVAAAQIGHAATKSAESTSDNSETTKANAEMSRTQAGLSIGYRTDKKIVPYLSYLHETYKVKSDITNTFGTFGPYTDKGKHQFIALGVMQEGPGFLWGIEYNAIIIDWDRASKHPTQGAFAFRLGGAW